MIFKELPVTFLNVRRLGAVRHYSKNKADENSERTEPANIGNSATRTEVSSFGVGDNGRNNFPKTQNKHEHTYSESDGRVSNPCFFVGGARLHDLWGRSAYRKGGDAVKYAVNTSANDELAILMEPYMSMQLTTPEMLWQAMQWMQVQFAKLASHRDTSSELRQEWGTPGDVAKIYGCDRTTAARHLIAWAEEGKVRVRLFYDELGDKPGHKRYSLSDVDRCMEENAIRESNRKGKKAA